MKSWGGGLRVFQRKKGYRFSLDSILLAHFVSLKPRTHVIDLGCGNALFLLFWQNVSRMFICVVWKFRDACGAGSKKHDLNDLDKRLKYSPGMRAVLKKFFKARSFDSVYI